MLGLAQSREGRPASRPSAKILNNRGKPMIPEKSPIFWEGKLIGHIGDMRGETFGVYGKWLPIDSPITTAFLKLLETNDEILAEVGEKNPILGGIGLDSFYEDQVDIKFRNIR
jgi:hypothetical protein